MNANRILASLVDIAKILSAAISAAANLELPVAIASTTSMNVSAIRAAMEPHALMVSIATLAIVFQGSPASIARQTSTNALAIPVPTEVNLFCPSRFLLFSFGFI